MPEQQLKQVFCKFAFDNKFKLETERSRYYASILSARASVTPGGCRVLSPVGGSEEGYLGSPPSIYSHHALASAAARGG